MITGYDDRVNIEDIHVTNSRFNNVEKKGNLITGAKDVVLKELYINGNKVRNKIKIFGIMRYHHTKDYILF